MSHHRFSKWILFAALLVVGVTGCSDHPRQPLEPAAPVVQPENTELVGQEIVISLAQGWTFTQVATVNGWTLLESNATSGLGRYDDNGTMKWSPNKTPSGVVIIEQNNSLTPPDEGMGDEDWHWGGGPDPMSGQSSLSMFNLNQVHNTTTGDGVRVAVIDTGLDTDHPVFQGRYFLGPYSKLTAADQWGHGTAVAGLVLTMAPNAEIFPINVFGPGSLTTIYDVANALQVALDYGADVVCLAVYSDETSTLVNEKLDALDAAGVFVVACAGNNTGGNAMFPASHGSVLSIGATDGQDVMAAFSADGPTVEFAAVGIGVQTTWPTDGGVPMGVTVTGTSVSTGLMAGYCAMAVQWFSTLSHSEILSEMIDAAKPVTDPDSGGVLYGRIDTGILLLPLGGGGGGGGPR